MPVPAELPISIAGPAAADEEEAAAAAVGAGAPSRSIGGRAPPLPPLPPIGPLLPLMFVFIVPTPPSSSRSSIIGRPPAGPTGVGGGAGGGPGTSAAAASAAAAAAANGWPGRDRPCVSPCPSRRREESRTARAGGCGDSGPLGWSRAAAVLSVLASVLLLELELLPAPLPARWLRARSRASVRAAGGSIRFGCWWADI